MSEETVTRKVPKRVDIHVYDGDNYLGVDHEKFRSKGGMVYLAGVEQREKPDGTTVHESVMIPTDNVRKIVEHAEEEEVNIEDEIEQLEEMKAKQTEVEDDADEGGDTETEVETPDDQPHLPNLTVDEVEEALEENTYHPDYLEFCIEEDDRVTAQELYQEALEDSN